MSEFMVYLVSGAALGCSFALIGSGFVVVHRVTRVVNFSQGLLAVLGGLISASLLSSALPAPLAYLVTLVLCALVGAAVGLMAIGRRSTPPLIALLVTLGASFIGSAVIIFVWGQDPISPPGIKGTVNVFGAELEIQRLVVVAVTVVAFVALAVFFDFTYLGKGLTAAASNPTAARLVGIDVRTMGLVAFAIAGALGGLAGLLIAPSSAVSYYSDLPLALSGFAAAVFGGLTSVWKTLVGGLALGIAGQLVAGYLSGSAQTEVALAMMLVVMILRHKSLGAEEAK
jgi:branched-chain amino acid transport system permease protein